MTMTEIILQQKAIGPGDIMSDVGEALLCVEQKLSK